ncbi:MAG: TolC family outer membrane protein [Candidatus Endonucleobacter bathymodioli]|uniref:TolC family outer membrane protein n=1 Tax=Candidatus Endonucleibacter bathymodioli TaxID=539814 RepID=A0AA90NN30_9GAMM|nr:TolC family outer membrane protein [Candidatus Endonucleobacter bathymodioli]
MSSVYCKALLLVLCCTVIDLQASVAQHNLLYVYDLAVKHDAQIAEAKARMHATLENTSQGRAALLPSLNLSANTQFNKVVTDVDGGSDEKGNYNSHGWSATLKQPLFNLERWFNYRQTTAVSDKVKSQFAAEQQDLILRVCEAYFNILRAEDSQITSKSEEKAVKQQLDQAQERYDVGLTAKTDVHEAQAEYDNSRVARILTDNQVSVSYENLRTIIDTMLNDIGKLKKSMPILAPTPAMIEDWVNNAVANNLNLQAARGDIVAAEENLRAKRSGHAPTVDAFASYNHTSTESGKARKNMNGGVASGRGHSTVVGLNLNMPIFSGGATISLVREANYLVEQSQQRFDMLLRETSSKTRNFFNTVNSDIERVEARKQGILSSESALKASQSGYEIGTRNITDVLESQKKLYTARRDYLNARYDFIINTLRLKQLTGTLSPDDINSLSGWITFSQVEH